MQVRKDVLAALIERVKANRVLLNIKTFKHNPTTAFTAADLPGIFMYEGVDHIVKASGSTQLGYPAIRECEVTLEIITDNRYDALTMFRAVRSTILNENSPRLVEGSSMREKYSEGPNGYGVPDVLGMRLVLGLTYMDDGT